AEVSLDFVLPHDDGAPAELPKPPAIAAIAAPVALDLFSPIARPELRSQPGPAVAVPEIAMNEHCPLPSRQRDVRRAGDAVVVALEANARLPQLGEHRPLQARVFRADARHELAAGRFRQSVLHSLGSWLMLAASLPARRWN